MIGITKERFEQIKSTIGEAKGTQQLIAIPGWENHFVSLSAPSEDDTHDCEYMFAIDIGEENIVAYIYYCASPRE